MLRGAARPHPCAPRTRVLIPHELTAEATRHRAPRPRVLDSEPRNHSYPHSVFEASSALAMPRPRPSFPPSARQHLHTSHIAAKIALNTRATCVSPLVTEPLVKHDLRLHRLARRLFSTEPNMHAAYNSAASPDPSPASSSSSQKAPPVPPSFAKDTTSWSTGSSRNYSCPGLHGQSKFAMALRIISIPYRVLLNLAAWCCVALMGFYVLLLPLYIICFFLVAAYIIFDHHFNRDAVDTDDAATALDIAAAESSTAQKDASAPLSTAANTQHPLAAASAPQERGPVSGAAFAVATVARNLGL